jgi:hypothetical protein
MNIITDDLDASVVSYFSNVDVQFVRGLFQIGIGTVSSIGGVGGSNGGE